MTTFVKVSFTCAVCGAQVERDEVASTYDLGQPDLDLRPPPTRRFTLEQEMAECGSCGYCANDPSAPITDDDRALVRSEPYQRIRSDPFPPLANRFRRAALHAERRREPWAVGELLLRAAWACDDAEAWTQASDLRGEAARRLEAELAGMEQSEATDFHRLRIADLLRRSGQFEAAIERVDTMLPRLPPGPPMQIARYQRMLAERRDLADYGVSDALAPETEWSSSHALGKRRFKWPGKR